jgi:ABC-type Fe3+-citrate transport system substrate-binding protein
MGCADELRDLDCSPVGFADDLRDLDCSPNIIPAIKSKNVARVGGGVLVGKSEGQ